jgi:hypothetical protein
MGDTGTALSVTLTDADGSPIDLTGKTVKMYVQHRLGGALVLDGVDVTPDADQVANTGVAARSWAAGDFTSPGVYLAEFEVDGAKVTTYPNDDYVLVVVTGRLRVTP